MKKDFAMDKHYEAGNVEDNIYKQWEESGYFNPDNLDLPDIAEPFVIVLPPPNITDKLHLGHAAMVAIEDAMVRFARMKGQKTLWIPGTDHAAIATQNVVEKKIWREEGKTRHDLGREDFLKKVWEFLYETRSLIQKQIRKVGGSLDWSRECFTLDEKRVRAVKEMFCRMYEEEVIYRGFRIVNWCPRCGSTLADDEVEYKEREAKLYYIKYGPFIVATTRPETKIGDTAAAINPQDKRYQDYLGKTLDINLAKVDIKVKVIADEDVSMGFGSGVVGVTPAHSFVDFNMAQKNNIKVIQVIGQDGKMTDKAGSYAGMDVLACREKFVKDLEDAGLLEKVEDIKNNLSVCYRCGTPIEPLVSQQWFVGVDKKLDRLGNKSLKEKALEVIDTRRTDKERINFVPSRFEKRYKDWMENLHDWCISRQIWFGHRIPVWYCADCGQTVCSRQDVVKECPKCSGRNLKQDEDSLDTWFSSGMWTFSTLGWPENTGDLKQYHPTSVLETGYEIITLWVSRMIMMSFFALEEKPFDTVYLHGMILDEHGKKMSKSKGNGIDPLSVIPKYGTDALRLSIIYGNTPGNDSRLSEAKIESMKHFVNKLWNISRYIITSTSAESEEIDLDNLTMADRWILKKNNELIIQVTELHKEYKISVIADLLKDYTWSDLADWYLEIAKVEGNKDRILRYLLTSIIKLWHPIMPFVTEHIWSYLGTDKLLIVSQWPEIKEEFDFLGDADDCTQGMVKLRELISAIRNIRAENKVEPRQKIDVYLVGAKYKELLESNSQTIKALARVKKLFISMDTPLDNGKTVKVILEGIKVIIPLAGMLDIVKEKARLDKDLERYKKLLAAVSTKLDNQDFIQKAPESVVAKEKFKVAEYTEIISGLEKNISDL